MDEPSADGHESLQENFEDFFEGSLFGLVTASPDGRILRANARLAGWLETTPEQLKGERFSNLLTVGGRIHLETHLWPLLKMQGHFDEIAVELRTQSGQRIPALVNASEQRDTQGKAAFVRLAVFRATDRLRYEMNLRQSKAVADAELLESRERLADEQAVAELREQFIAVLGHDLRNPLGAIEGGLSLLNRLPVGERALAIVDMLKKSSGRMAELISDVMDFARGRLGSGISLNRQATDIGPILSHVVDELHTAHPHRSIIKNLHFDGPVDCDPARISQVLSNLLANALTHGSHEGPIHVDGFANADAFEFSVGNPGRPIPPDILPTLFEPFSREEVRPSQQGLGLGLFIAAEIARAHGASLSVTSDEHETRFKFHMPRQLRAAIAAAN